MVLYGRSGWAVHIPVLFSFVSAVALFGSSLSLQKEISGGPLVGALLSLGLSAFTLSELRLLWARGEVLFVRTIYRELTLPRDSVAFGVRVTHSGRSAPNYTIYAQADSLSVDLASALSMKGAQRLRRRLERSLLLGRLPTVSARKATDAIAQAEAAQEAQSRNAQKIVAKYYASGRGKRAVFYVGGFLLLYVLALALYVWLGNGRI